MSETNLTPPAPVTSPVTIFWRFSWPFFLFTAVLLGIFALSWIFLLPRYTRVEVNGIAMTGMEIREKKNSLTAQVAELEGKRRTLVLAVHDPAYEALKEHRRERKTLESVTTAFEEHAKTVENGTVRFRSFAYDPEKNTLTLRGDVRDAGVSSMTVLAVYAESLKTLPGVQSVSTPAFARMDDSTIGLYSPFDITVTFE